MSLHSYKLSSAALIILVTLAAQALAQPASQPSAAGANGTDIELGKPPKYPTIITPTTEGGRLLDNHHGDPVTLQEIVFDPATHELSLPKNSPNKQRIYADSKIDAANYGSELVLFDYLTTDRTPIGKIVLTVAKKKAVISPNYVVSQGRDKPAKIDPATYRAFVQFEKGDECNKPGTTVTIRRNTDPATPLADVEFTKINRKTDIITWSIERSGSVVKSGSFGFPVVATEPELVKYVIQLP